jgi:hypothetical protein
MIYADNTPVEIMNKEHISAAQEFSIQNYNEIFDDSMTVSEQDNLASEVMGREAALIDEYGAVS